MKVHLAKPQHQVLYQELAKILKERTEKLSAVEVLAVAANMVGKIIAMQDQRVISPEQALAIVAENIESGNKQVLEDLREQTAGRA
jgi:hypothetical protein